MRRLALIISYVLHPLWMPLLVFLTLWVVDPWLRLQPTMMIYVASILVINALAPAVSLLVLHRRGVLSDLEVSRRNERTVPFLVVLFYQVLGYYALTRPGVYLPSEVLNLILGMMASVGAALVLNHWIKVSMHLFAQGGALGALWSFNLLHDLSVGWVLPLGFLLAGLVGWSRMRLGVHTTQELSLGFLLGFVMLRATVELGAI